MRLHRHRHAEERRHDLACRTAACSARRRDARRARRRPASAPGRVVSISTADRRPAARTGAGDTRPAARDPRARPAPRPSGSRRPRASAPRADRRSPRVSSRRNAACDTRCARLADRRVGQRPVHRQPEVPPQMLEGLLVLGRQPVAQLDEVRPRDRNRLLARLLRRRERRDRTAATDRSGRRSSSARAARSAGRCRPTPSGRTPPCRACAESAR